MLKQINAEKNYIRTNIFIVQSAICRTPEIFYEAVRRLQTMAKKILQGTINAGFVEELVIPDTVAATLKPNAFAMFHQTTLDFQILLCYQNNFR